MKRRGTLQRRFPVKKRRRTVTPIPPTVPPLKKVYDVVDYKVTDYYANPTVSNTGYIQNLLTNALPGTGFYDEFIGSKFMPAGLQFRFGVVNGDNTNMFRLVIFQWLQEATPAINGILQTFSVYAPLNVDNRENIIVLRDMLIPLYAHGNANIHLEGCMVYVKGKKMVPCFWNRALQVWQKGSIYVLMLSDSAAPPSPTVSFWSRLTFTDS